MKAVVKILWFVLFCLAILATIGGTGYLFYFKQPLFAVAVLVFSGYGWYHLSKKLKTVLYE